MNRLTALLAGVLGAGWAISIAVLSAQNLEPISIRFLTFRSVPVPTGVALGLGTAAGAGIAGIIPLLGLPSKKRRSR